MKVGLSDDTCVMESCGRGEEQRAGVQVSVHCFEMIEMDYSCRHIRFREEAIGIVLLYPAKEAERKFAEYSTT